MSSMDDNIMDFIENLPQSNDKNTILVAVDRFSNSTHFLALAHPFIAKIVTKKIIDVVVKLHGMPRTIISNWDPIFISYFWHEFFKMSNTHLKMSFAYHPYMDGQFEVINRCLEQYLPCFAHQQPQK